MSIKPLEALHFRNLAGNYLGGFAGIEVIDDDTGQVVDTEQPLPDDVTAIEVPSAPEDGRQIWDGSKWIDSPEMFTAAKSVKRQEFKNETVVRMEAQVSAWNSFERIEFLLSIANLLNITNLTAAQTLARDILQYTRNTAIPKVNAVITQAGLDAIDPSAADPFGDGTPWPT